MPENKPPPQLPCERIDSNAVTDLDKDLKTKNCDTADANEINKTPFPSPPPVACNSQTSNSTCPSTLPGINATGSSNPKSLAKEGSPKNNVTAPASCKANPSDPSCPQNQNLPLTTKKCSDGSLLAVSAICPTNIPPTPPTPPNLGSNNPSTNSPSGGSSSQSPPSNNPSSNGNKGDSSSSSSGTSGSSGSKHHHRS